MYVFDLVTDERYRAEGYGKMMLEYLVDYAKVGMCENIVLSSGFQREAAHKFYDSKGFTKKSFVFVKKIGENV